MAALIVVPGGAELLAEAVEKLLAYPDAASLRSGADKSALSDTVLALAGDDIAYLPLLARYFNMLADGPGAAFHQQHSVPLIQRRHGQGCSSTANIAVLSRICPGRFPRLIANHRNNSMNANVRTNICLQQAKLFFIGPELIQVIQSSAEADTLLWQCELPGTEDGELALLQWLDDTRFLALGQNGLLFVCDYQARSCEQVLDLQITGSPGPGSIATTRPCGWSGGWASLRAAATACSRSISRPWSRCSIGL